MTDDELRKEVDALKERVRRLEEQAKQSETANTPHGADHRDNTVLGVLSELDDEPGPRELVTLYQMHTDITAHKTAKRRAKQLVKKDAYREAVEE